MRMLRVKEKAQQLNQIIIGINSSINTPWVNKLYDHHDQDIPPYNTPWINGENINWLELNNWLHFTRILSPLFIVQFLVAAVRISILHTYLGNCFTYFTDTRHIEVVRLEMKFLSCNSAHQCYPFQTIYGLALHHHPSLNLNFSLQHTENRKHTLSWQSWLQQRREY